MKRHLANCFVCRASKNHTGWNRRSLLPLGAAKCQPYGEEGECRTLLSTRGVNCHESVGERSGLNQLCRREVIEEGTVIANVRVRSRLFPLFIRAAAFSLCGFALVANWSSAQTAGTGALSGRVVDPSSGLITGAKIVVTSQATGESRTVMSNSSGVFQVSALLPELYTVVASKDGFKTLNVQNVQITVTETVTLNCAWKSVNCQIAS